MLDEKQSTPLHSSPSSRASTMHHSNSNLDLESGDSQPHMNDSPQLHQIRSITASEKRNGLTNSLSRSLSRIRTDDSLDPGPPPDSGWTAWSMVVLTHLVIFCTWGFINSFGVFQTYYVEVLHLGSNSEIAWIGSLQVFILFGMGTFSGRAMDAGFFKLCFISGSVLYVFGIFMASLSRTYWQVFLAQGVCVALGNGLVFVPSVALVSTYFDKNRGKAFGVVTAGSATGGLVFPAIAESLLPRVGYGNTVRVMGGVMAIAAIICAIFMKPRLPPRKSGPIVEWSAFTELPYTLFLIGAFFLFWGVYIGFYFVGSFGRTILHTDASTSINLLLVMNGVGVPARIIPTIVADQFTGPLNILIPCAAATGVTVYCWMTVTSVSGLWAFAVFYGICASTIQALFPVVLTSLTSDPKKVGVRTGMGFTVIGCAVLTGPPLAGGLIGIDGGKYLYTQIFVGTSMLFGACILIVARWAKVGLMNMTKV